MNNGRLKPIEILMIDDNPADVDLVRETFLERMQASVLNEVHDGDEALQYLRRYRAVYQHRAARPDPAGSEYARHEWF